MYSSKKKEKEKLDHSHCLKSRNRLKSIKNAFTFIALATNLSYYMSKWQDCGKTNRDPNRELHEIQIKF